MQASGSQSWDAGFMVQALLATDLMKDFGPTLAKAYDFLKKSQVPKINKYLDKHTSVQVIEIDKVNIV